MFSSRLWTTEKYHLFQLLSIFRSVWLGRHWTDCIADSVKDGTLWRRSAGASVQRMSEIVLNHYPLEEEQGLG